MSDTARVMILGAAGNLGTQLAHRLGRVEQWEVIPRDLPELDLTCDDDLRAAVREARPAWIVNCAALTNVDHCEAHPDETERVNARPVAVLAELCREMGTRLVQISTDFVFDGCRSRPYREEDAPNPLNVYGRCKLRAEEYAGRCERHLIVRTAWLYGPGGKDFVARILARVRSGEPLRVVSDQIGSPTCSVDLAEAIAKLMGAEAEGTFHVVNGGQATWHDLARRAVELAGLNTPVKPIPSSAYPSPATRPAFSVLDCAKYTRTTGHQLREWPAALAAHLRGE